MNPDLDEALEGEALSAILPYLFARSFAFACPEPAGIVLYLF